MAERLEAIPGVATAEVDQTTSLGYDTSYSVHVSIEADASTLEVAREMCDLTEQVESAYTRVTHLTLGQQVGEVETTIADDVLVCDRDVLASARKLRDLEASRMSTGSLEISSGGRACTVTSGQGLDVSFGLGPDASPTEAIELLDPRTGKSRRDLDAVCEIWVYSESGISWFTRPGQDRSGIAGLRALVAAGIVPGR
ncbi:MAG TPA: hypothetical protein VGC37_09570, partial [Friedmanniella sp.]